MTVPRVATLCPSCKYLTTNTKYCEWCGAVLKVRAKPMLTHDPIYNKTSPLSGDSDHTEYGKAT